MRSSVRWFVLLVSLTLTSLSSPALAGNPLARPISPDAREHLDRGNKLYNVGSFADAIVEYKAGALIESAAVFDYNLGQAHRQLGKYREALWHYDRFLHKGQPTGQLRDAVIAFMAEMRSQLENKAQSMPPTGPEPSSEPPPPTVPRSSPTSSAQAPTVSAPPPIIRSEAWYEDGWGWALSGAGVVGIAAGGALLADAAGINSDANTTTNQQDRDRLRQQAHTRNVLGVVVGAGGLGLLTLGIVKLSIHPKERPAITSWNIAVTGSGVSVLGRF
jgi:tetratricopeptide (TPR) repeat protein